MTFQISALRISCLMCCTCQGAEYGYHPGGWGKPPVDEFAAQTLSKSTVAVDISPRFLRRTFIYGYIVSAYLSNELVDQFKGKLPETPTFDGKRPWFPVDFPLHQSNESLTYLQRSVSNWKGASCIFTNRGLGILCTATGRQIRCPGWSKPMEYRIAGMNIHLHPFIIHLHISG